MRPTPLLLALAVGLAGCERPPRDGAPTRLERLLPGLGPAEAVTLDSDTRPATRLRPGEVRATRVVAGRGSRLFFGVGLTDEAPRDGVIRVRVRAAGRMALDETLRASRRRWLNLSPVLPGDGAMDVELAFEHLAAPGGPRVAPATDAAWLALASPRVVPARPARKPRVLVWISQDTLRADRLPAYGYGRPTAPNFERLARGFAIFEQATATASWTLPSLASQLTSRYPSFHGATHHTRKADGRYPTLFETLAAEGFAVLGVTGNSFVSPGYNLARGFDSLVYTGLRADVVSRLAEQRLEQWGGGDLALFVHYMDPHHPYEPPPPFDARFGEPYAGIVDGYNFRSAAKTQVDLAHVGALYDGEIAWTDQQIATLLERLQARGLLDGAVIAYSADHGDELREHGGWGHAHSLYEELVHVPFALRVPGVPPGRVAAPVSLLDLAPTLLDALGVRAPRSYQGRSLLPVLRGAPAPQDLLFAETARTTGSQQVAVREGRLKYIARFNVAPDGARRLKRDHFFDLEADPGEQRNLDDPAARDRLRRELAAYLARAAAAGTREETARLTPEEEEQLRALGYVN